jgi:uncharacterized protein YjbI with pentapeptide repeats
MAKKKTVAEAAVEDWQPALFRGKSFALVGKFSSWQQDRLGECVAALQGRLVTATASDIDILVVSPTPSGSVPPAAKKLIATLQQAGKEPQVLTIADLGKQILPTREQAIALLKRGDPKAIELWNLIRPRSAYGWIGRIDLANADLRGAQAAGALFANVAILDGADFRDADLSGAHFYGVTGVRFDGANLSKTQLGHFSQCSFRDVDLSSTTHFWGWDWVGSNFEGAKLRAHARSGINAAGVCFRRADIEGVNVSGSQFPGADFSRANLAGANLNGCNLTGAKPAHARLRGTDLSGAILVSADLTGADLREANLVGADLTGAQVAGARFDQANLTGANLSNLDAAKAKGLDLSKAVVGPNALVLEQAAQTARRFTTSAVLDLSGSYVEVKIERTGTGPLKIVSNHYVGGEHRYAHHKPLALGLAFAVLGHNWRGSSLRLDSVKVRGDGLSLGGKALQQAALAAWSEAVGAEVASSGSLKEQRQSQRADQQRLREQLLTQLRGANGVVAWNARTVAERAQANPFAGADLAGLDLTGVNFQSCDFRKANFARTNLTELVGKSVNLTQANLAGAQLRKADLTGAKLNRADLQGADLCEAELSFAKFGGANVCGADLSSAHVRYSTDFNKVTYDAKTRWPAGFRPPHTAVLEGAKPAAPVVVVKPVVGLEFPTFMDRLRQTVDGSRLTNALQMLKSERFHLFAEVKPEVLVGIVRSQSSASRLYSCRLAADGAFSCGTQNLRVCGGLYGSICKHLLVLIVGLAKAGTIDLGNLDAWCRASRQHRPTFDKDVMSETFLRYKGAEAGEVDWRPTETLPEDYYAL